MRRLADLLWNLTRKVRGQMHHGTGRCPQRFSPINPSSLTDILCDSCASLHLMHLEVARKRAERLELTDWASIRNYVVKHHKHMLFEARDLLDGQNGLLVKPGVLTKRKWFTDALPDAIDQKLMITVLYFLRSGDMPGQKYGTTLPIDTLACGLNISAHECRTRITNAIDALTDAKPAFVRVNIEGPLSQLAGSAGERYADWQDGRSIWDESHPEDDPNPGRSGPAAEGHSDEHQDDAA